MKKGITPIIAIIILLVITIGLAGLVWSFFSGYLGAFTEKSFNVPPGTSGAYCSAGVITVVITNTGTSVLTDTDFVEQRVFSVPAAAEPVCTSMSFNPPRLITHDMKTRGETGETTGLVTCNCGSSCGTGTYVVYIGTSAGVKQLTVTC